jgi:hypothetical protein
MVFLFGVCWSKVVQCKWLALNPGYLKQRRYEVSMVTSINIPDGTAHILHAFLQSKLLCEVLLQAATSQMDLRPSFLYL